MNKPTAPQRDITRILFISLISLILGITISSCAMEKRQYRPGVHIESLSKNNKADDNNVQNIDPKTKKQVPVPVTHSDSSIKKLNVQSEHSDTVAPAPKHTTVQDPMPEKTTVSSETAADETPKTNMEDKKPDPSPPGAMLLVWIVLIFILIASILIKAFIDIVITTGI